MRRNPYYWKVDETGNQLPYLNELHYRLSTWADRDVQAVAGSGDFSNLEQPENFVESLKRAARGERAGPPRLRAAPHRLSMLPEPLGQWLGRTRRTRPGGPRTQPQPGFPQGRHHGARPPAARRLAGQGSVHRHLSRRPVLGHRASTTGQSTVYYPYDLEGAKALLEKAGLKDTDGNGFVNFPAGTAGGQDVEIVLLANTDYSTDKNLAEGVDRPDGDSSASG